MYFLRIVPFFLVGSIFWTPSRAQGGPITTFEFSGIITNIFDPNDLMEGQVVLGTPFQGSFSVDLSTPDSDTISGARGIYSNAIIAVEGQVGPFTFSSQSPVSEIEIRDEYGSSADVIVYNADVPFVGQDMDFLIALFDHSGTSLTSDSLPTLPPDLNDFDMPIFAIEDRTQTAHLAITGQITTLVPEPATLILFGGVAGAIGLFCKRPSRKCLRKIMLLTLVASSGSYCARATATDCNSNGVEDSDEVSAAGECKVDIIVAFDTSSSMGNTLVGDMCIVMSSVSAILAANGADLVLQRLAISGGSQSAPCTASTCCGAADVPNDYGTTTTGLGISEVLGTCGSSTTNVEANQEDWGVAISVIAAERSWRTGALRVVIPVSDTYPRCGSPNDSGDTTVINHAIAILGNNQVTPIPIVGSLAAVVGHAEDLVDGVGRGLVLQPSEGGLAPKIAAYVLRHCPTDCNGNGVLDECDIGNSTSCDEDDDGLPDECYACCTEGSCRNRPSEICDAGTSDFYHGMTCGDCTCAPFTACCINGECCDMPACACQAAGGFPVASATCTTSPCDTGACCDPGVCVDDVAEENCDGVAWIPGTSCDTLPYVCDRVDPCPAGAIDTTASTNPPNNVVDARIPHVQNNSSAKRGIGYEGTGARAEDEIKIKLVSGSSGVTGATAAECWCLCETAEDAALGRNSITCIDDLGSGFYRIHVARPITTHQITTISYKHSANSMKYISHPANINGDGASQPSDILTLIDYLNGVGPVPWGKWSCDIDRSGVCAPADIIAEIDMLNGNGFAAWNGTSKPTSTDCPALTYCDFGQASCGFSSMLSGSSESEESDGFCDNECVTDYVVNLLSTFDAYDSLSEEELAEVVSALGQWCIDHFSSSNQAALVDRLSGATYASQAGYLAALELSTSLGY